MSGPPKAFADLHRLPEDERIVVIGEYCLARPSEKVAICVDDEPDKPERYKRKLEAKYPQLRVKVAGRLFKGVIVLHITCPPAG